MLRRLRPNSKVVRRIKAYTCAPSKIPVTRYWNYKREQNER